MGATPAQSLYSVLRHWRSVGVRWLDVPELTEEDLFSEDELLQHRQAELEQWKGKCEKCTQCSLYQDREQIVWGEGNPMAKLMFIGDAPEPSDEKESRPFTGETGELFDRMLSKMGLSREQIYITYLLKCAPREGKKPSEEMGMNCRELGIFKQIDVIRPSVICTLGSYASSILLDTKEPITRLRGRAIPWSGAMVFPSFHPGYLLKKKSARIEAWEDMKAILVYLQSSAH